VKDEQEDKRKADKKVEKKKDEERRRKGREAKAGWAATQDKREGLRVRLKTDRAATESDRRYEQEELKAKDEAAKRKLEKEATAREKRRFEADLEDRARQQGK
jgi:hypothetical protein